MLNFLNPWLWLGLIAIGAPLWLHLRRKEREDIIRFSTLRFLEDQPIARQSPLRLRNLLLFLLRLLAVVALVAAFAQPFLAQSRPAASSSEVYVLDNTLSRQAENGLEHDRAYLIHELNHAGPHDQIAVVELSEDARVVVDFGDSPALAEAKLNALQPTAQRGAMVTALREANLLIRRSLGERKHITILTDSQQNQWSENSETPPFLTPGLLSVVSGSGLDSRPNFFVGEPKLQRVFLGDRAVIQFTAEVGHSGNVNSGTLQLNVNGQDILEHGILLDDKTDQVSVAAQWDSDPSVWLVGAIKVTARPDDLPQDDAAYFTLPPVTEGRVALLTQSVYLKTALSTAVARGHWSAKILQPADLPSLLTASSDPDADVLMIDGDYLQASQGRDLVDRYVKSDRGVFVMMGRSSPLLNGFVQQLGFEPELQLPSDLAPVLQPIRYFTPESPIFRPFSIPDFSNLLEVRIGNPVHLRPLTAKPLLFSQNGDGLLFEVPRERGRILLSTFAFDRSQTDWVIHPSFVPFLDAALQYLRPVPQLSSTLEPGEIWLTQLPPGRQARIAFLRDMHGAELAHAPVDQEHRRATLRAPGSPGVYALTYDADPAVQQMLSVNPSLKESDLRYLTGPPDVLKAWTLAKPATAPAITAVLPAATLGAQQILWWELLLAGSLALFVEMVWLARPGRGT
jgi:hypothetical protein